MWGTRGSDWWPAVSNNAVRCRFAGRTASDADDLEIRLTRIKDLIEELERLGLRTSNQATDYALTSLRCTLLQETGNAGRRRIRLLACRSLAEAG